MAETAKRLLDAFDALPDGERHEVVREILRHIAQAEHGQPEDADFLVLADEVFRELDHAEAPR